MVFSDQDVEKAWENAEGKCECKRLSHAAMHGPRCNKKLDWNQRGRVGKGAWEAHHKTGLVRRGSNSSSNCEILCWECHKETF